MCASDVFLFDYEIKKEKKIITKISLNQSFKLQPCAIVGLVAHHQCAL